LRNYVLTKKERRTLQHWLETGDEQPGYHTLKTRITHNFFPISEDIRLITKYLIQIEENLPAESRLQTKYIKTWVLEYLREAAPEKIPDVQGILEKLGNHSKLLVAALENSPEAIIILDKDFGVLYVNDAFARLSGRSREEMSGLLISDFFNGIDYGGFKAQLQSEGSLRSEAPVMIRGEEGRVGWVEFNASTIMRDGEILAYTATIRDITNKKEVELEVEALLKKLINNN
jgi:PAS domain S-box-containing protein